MNIKGFSLLPKFIFRSLVDITPDFIEKQGIKFLMFDLDNTIASYAETTPSEAVLQWFGKFRERGITLFLVSNSKRNQRVENFASALSVGYVMRAGKPSPAKLLESMRAAGFDAQSSGFIGDQIITDILAANRAGIVSIIVEPIRLSNPFFIFRYLCELPFRWISKLRQRKITARLTTNKTYVK